MVHTQVFIIYIKIKIKLNTDNNLDLKVFWHHACTYYFGQLQQWMYLKLTYAPVWQWNMYYLLDSIILFCTCRYYYCFNKYCINLKINVFNIQIFSDKHVLHIRPACIILRKKKLKMMKYWYIDDYKQAWL